METTYLSVNTDIRLDTRLYYGLPGTVTSDGVTADANGKKIIKAGTPVGGVTSFLADASQQLTVFKGTSASSTSGNSSSGASSAASSAADDTPSATSAATTAQGIVLHDVDVTSGSASVTIMLFGFVNFNLIDTATQALITDDVKTALPDIKFIKR